MNFKQLLSDKLIPGFFGHVGIYLGNETFAESLQKGVVYSNSIDFTKGNSIIVIRPKRVTKEQSFRMNEILAAQIGKNYDYNFNVESPDEIFCSELIYLVYEQIEWKTKNIGSQFAISPDHVVQTALKNKQFAIPFYSNNENQIKNPNSIFVSNSTFLN
jgi:uncharacterized protein YycO